MPVAALILSALGLWIPLLIQRPAGSAAPRNLGIVRFKDGAVAGATTWRVLTRAETATASPLSPKYDAAVSSLWAGHRRVGEEETWNKSCLKVFPFAPNRFFSLNFPLGLNFSLLPVQGWKKLGGLHLRGQCGPWAHPGCRKASQRLSPVREGKEGPSCPRATPHRPALRVCCVCSVIPAAFCRC